MATEDWNKVRAFTPEELAAIRGERPAEAQAATPAPPKVEIPAWSRKMDEQLKNLEAQIEHDRGTRLVSAEARAKNPTERTAFGKALTDADFRKNIETVTDDIRVAEEKQLWLRMATPSSESDLLAALDRDIEKAAAGLREADAAAKWQDAQLKLRAYQELRQHFSPT